MSVALLASAGGASAATWFAAPAGTGVNPCPISDPCALDDALNGAPDDSKVAALAGTYVLGAAGLNVSDGISLQGPWSGAAARVVGNGSAGAAITATDAGTRVTDLSIEQSGSAIGIRIGDGALGDRLTATTSGSNAACAPIVGGLLRDSVCSATGAGGNGVLIAASTPVSGSAELVNVTAISAGDAGTAAPIRVSASGGAQIDVAGANLIASSLGAAPEIAIGALVGPSSADFSLTHSNYDSIGDIGIDTAVTPVGSNGNQTADPIFTDALAGNFSEVAGSPTIDAGAASVPSLGLLDVLRRARILDGTPDIGAFEYVAPPDIRPPNVFIVTAPKGKLKTKARHVDATFELASDEQDVTFTCQLDRNPAERCSSPVTYELDSSRGVGTRYELTVVATDAAGNRSGKAVRVVTVIRKSKSAGSNG